MQISDNQGWQSPKHQYNIEQERILLTKYKKDNGNSILKQTKHSLQPDMAMGWKPKLPSCPLPLSYFNAYNQRLMQLIPKDDRFKIVYLGRRMANSVQVNQQYSYFWRYRQRYSLNIAIVQQCVKQVGNNSLNHEILAQNQISSKELTFDSSFESGNLQMAVKVKPNEYDLFLRSDTNTKGHTNWYYFKVNNQNHIGSVQLNICNMGKTKTLYNKGMKPYVFQTNSQNMENSEKVMNNPGKWSQNKTYDVCFVERYCRYGVDKKTFHLQFKYNFKKPNTQVYFAYGIPYTYSQLEKFITSITETNKQNIKCQKLCESLGGLNLQLLTISSQDFFNSPEQIDLKSDENSIFSKDLSLNNQKLSIQSVKKKAVLITGRVHPGQSNASYILEGFIKKLLQNSQNSKKLLQRYVFYIIPMLNPDGVVVGNFRTSYSGKDLNRQFNKLNKFIYPQIFELNQLALKLKEKYKRKLEFYFDFHGHSSKKNLFCYGPEHPTSSILFFKCRTFAKIIEQINPIFSYRKSIFQVSEHKKTTARAHMFGNLKIPMTYTFQISNGLYENKEGKNNLLDYYSLIQAGQTVFAGLFKYISIQTKNFGFFNTKAKVDTGIRSRKVSSQKNVRQKSSKIQSLNQNKKGLQISEYSLSRVPYKFQSQVETSLQFEKYIRQIKNQHLVDLQAEGGSDSQGSQEDLSAEELNQLHEFVKTRTQKQRQYSKRLYNFKIKPVKKDLKIRKSSFQDTDESNKENSNTQNLRNRINSTSGIQTGRRLYQLSQKGVGMKKPALPIPKIFQKFVLQQKKFTVEF